MDRKDVGSGAFFMAVGVLYGSVAATTLPIGVALHMGPGYFPLVLSGLLFLLGVVIAVRGLINGGEFQPFGQIPWRAVVVLSLATILFALLLEHSGLLLTVFLTAWLAALAKPGVSFFRTGIAALCIAVFCTGVFSYGIGLNVPVFGDWIMR